MFSQSDNADAGWSEPPAWDAAVDAIKSSSSVLLIAHVTPDADALGSAIALGLALEQLEKHVVVSVGEPGFSIPDTLDFLPGAHLVVAPDMVGTPDLVISCDTASIERLGSLAEVLASAPQSLALDHHPSFSGFADLHIVIPTAAATAQIALELIDRLGVPLDREIATAVYCGLVTDTGSFKFHATTGDTLRMAARLFDTGIDHTSLARKLFDDEPIVALKMMAHAVERAVLVPEAAKGRGFVYTSISIDQRGDQTELAMERVIEAIRRTAEAEVAAVFKQADDGRWKGSLRSKTDVSVGAVAIALGGGGHKYAAGFTGTTDLDETIALVMAEINRAK